MVELASSRVSDTISITLHSSNIIVNVNGITPSEIIGVECTVLIA